VKFYPYFWFVIIFLFIEFGVFIAFLHKTSIFANSWAKPNRL